MRILQLLGIEEETDVGTSVREEGTDWFFNVFDASEREAPKAS